MKLYLKHQLLKNNIVQFGEFVLKSGQKSSVYVNLKNLISYPNLLSGINQYLSSFLLPFKCEDTVRLCGVPYGGIPISTGLSAITGLPQILLRKEQKTYGTKKLIEGEYALGDDVIIIEDVITSGTSVRETIEILTAEGLNVVKVISIVFRGTPEVEKELVSKYNYSYIFNMGELISSSSKCSSVSSDDYETKMGFEQIKKNKNSNIFIALDRRYTLEELLNLVDTIGDNVFGFKVHNEILGLTYAENYSFYLACNSKNILVWEDRKFNDIGNTIQKQLKYYESIRDFVSIVPTSGMESIINLNTSLKFLVLCEMSSSNNLFTPVVKNGILDIVFTNPDKFAGIICQDLELISFCKYQYMNLLTIMPGINLDRIGDNRGQQYRDPRSFPKDVVPDLYVVGRGITNRSGDIFSNLEYYNKSLYFNN
jgi:uridine monophosphate synthetase